MSRSVVLHGRITKVAVKERMQKVDGVDFPADPVVELGLRLDATRGLVELLAEVGRDCKVEIVILQPHLPRMGGDGTADDSEAAWAREPAVAG
jgi:hypothetical protein